MIRAGDVVAFRSTAKLYSHEFGLLERPKEE
jgi:hypothetical protein